MSRPSTTGPQATRAVSANSCWPLGNASSTCAIGFGAHAGEHLRRVRAANGRGEVVAQRFGVRERRPPGRGVPALHDRPMKVAGASRRHDVQADAVPPADCPAIVTLSGSPPNAAM